MVAGKSLGLRHPPLNHYLHTKPTETNVMTAKLDEAFYRDKSWGVVAIKDSYDLPTLKLRYLMELLAKRERSNASLLEIGSGSGRILSSIRSRDEKLQLTGVDLSAEQTELAKSTHEGIDFLCANGESLPFADESFDFVVFFDYLEHIENPKTSLEEMLRVLKPGGYLYMACPTEAQSIFWLSTKILGTHIKRITAGHIQQFGRRELEQLIDGTGFRIIDEKFSYHLLGGIMDYILFALMLNKRIYRIYWTQNAYYARAKDQAKGGLFNFLLRLGNAIAYAESSLLRNVRMTSIVAHITARK
jgi:ubiquinone/menaquinone biosynthesis C-methylase UbiE